MGLKWRNLIGHLLTTSRYKGFSILNPFMLQKTSLFVNKNSLNKIMKLKMTK